MASSGKSDKALRTIGEVADELNVATHVLRFWESKFHQIKPQKRRGRRYYRPEDVIIITRIQELLYEKGFTIRGVQKYLLEEAKTKSSANNQEQEAEMVSPAPESPAPNAPLNPALFNNTSNTNTQTDFTSFKTDIFGNIIPANAGPIAGIGNQKLSTPVTGDEKSYSEQDIEKLQEIHNGLQEARKRLKDVA